MYLMNHEKNKKYFAIIEMDGCFLPIRIKNEEIVEENLVNHNRKWIEVKTGFITSSERLKFYTGSDGERKVRLGIGENQLVQPV